MKVFTLVAHSRVARFVRRLRPSRRSMVIIVVYLVCWYGLDQAGQELEAAQSISIWYPPAALDLALVLAYGTSFAPVLAFGPVIHQLFVTTDPWPLPVVLLMAWLRVFGYGSIAWILLRWLHTDVRWASVRDVIGFVGIGSLVGPLFIAAGQVTFFALFGVISWDEWLPQGLLVWAGIATGIVVFTPVLLPLLRWMPSLSRRVRAVVRSSWRWPNLPVREILAGAAATLVLLVGIYIAYGSPRARELDYTYFVFLPLVWITVRYELPGALFAIVLINIGAAILVARDVNQEQAFAVQFGLMIVSQSGLLLGAFIRQRQQEHNDRLRLERTVMDMQRTESLGRMARGVAHDFNTLLQAIREHIRTSILALPTGTPAVSRLRDADQAVEQATDLTQQILASAGVTQVETERLDLNTLVREMSSLLRSALPQNVVFELQLAPILPTVAADATQLRQVVINLMLNAAEAMHGTPGTITIATSSASAAKVDALAATQAHPAERYVCLRVTDTGWGIQPDIEEQIFEPFFSTKEQHQGLGLAMIQGIVQGHNGAIDVQTELGIGSTFSVWLPANTVPQPIPAAITPQYTILIVDNDQEIRTIARQMLTRWSYEVLTAADSVAVLALLRDHHKQISCVLLDMGLTGSTSAHTAAMIRRLAPNVPIIWMSESVANEHYQQMGALSISALLRKPFTLDQLADTLLQTMSNRQ